MENTPHIFEKIADQLAFESYALVDEFISLEQSKAMRSILQQHFYEGQMKKAGIGTFENFQIDKSIRGDHVKWIEPDAAYPVTLEFYSKIKELMGFINRTCFLSLKDLEAHYAYYPENTYYKRHLDKFINNSHRKLTFICYLNNEWKHGDGGELRIYLKNDSHHDVEPIGGRLVCFKSDELEHEVLLAKKSRYSITGWMLDQPKGLTFL